MNSFLRKAQAQSGQELLSGKLDPSFYAAVLAEAGGNVEVAMGLYAERRAEAIYEQLLDDDERAKQRFQAMAWVPKSRSQMRSEIDLFRPFLLLVGTYLGAVSVLLCLCGMKHGEICAQGLGKVGVTAALLTILCVTVAVWIRSVFRRVSLVSAMMPFAILLAVGSLGAATLMVKSSKKTAWNTGAVVELVVREE